MQSIASIITVSDTVSLSDEIKSELSVSDPTEQSLASSILLKRKFAKPLNKYEEVDEEVCGIQKD